MDDHKKILVKAFYMRYIVLLIVAVILFYTAVAQPKTKEYFLQKSKRQKTTAWIVLGTGIAAITAGAIIENTHKGEDMSAMGGYLEIGGIICTLTSIPFFISSSRNKRMAVALTFNNGKRLLPHDNLIASRKYAVSLLIPLSH